MKKFFDKIKYYVLTCFIKIKNNLSKIHYEKFVFRLKKILPWVVCILLYFYFIFYFVNVIQEFSIVFFKITRVDYKISGDKNINEKQLKKLISSLEKNNKKLERKINWINPYSAYMVVNTTTNTFRLYKGQTLIKEGICSTGSYILLEAPDQRKWIFKTPRGVFRIQGKTTSPVWIKPDWAFIEEGLPVPPPNHESRYEYGVLGDYALSLGNGYLIHGTLYKRFLGLPVTHGCIRLNDEDLELVYKTLNIGSKVFIY